MPVLPRGVPVERIDALCSLPDVGPVSPGNVTDVTSRVVGLPTESYVSEQRNVFPVINVTWSRPEQQGSGITNYHVRVGLEPLELDDTSNPFDFSVDSSVLSTERQFSIRNAPAGTLTLFVQVPCFIVHCIMIQCNLSFFSLPYISSGLFTEHDIWNTIYTPVSSVILSFSVHSLCGRIFLVL